MASPQHTKLLIIGSGPAGYTAAIYAARASLAPICVTGLQPGGQLTITTDVENYPGFAEPVQGPWLMDQMRAQAAHVGTTLLDDIVAALDLSVRPFRATLDGGDVIFADAVVIATGASARWLGLPEEEDFRGFGLSACATCDGFFFRGKTVAVIGGGNSAVEEALYLTNHAAKVYLIHRRDSLRAEKILQQRLFAHPKITILWNRAVAEIGGSRAAPRAVTHLVLTDTQSGARENLPIDGAFVAIGHSPQTDLVREQLAIDADGYIITAPDSTATAIPGVFAAGDVKDKVFRQAVTAAGMGCMAALEAERWLAAQAHQQIAAE